jgi:hypothetical protein
MLDLIGSYDEIDLNLRHKSFLLAIHYCEERWDLKSEVVLVKKV